jgi:hypothetical protein
MSKLLYGNGTAHFKIAALDKLAVFSEDDIKIYKTTEFSQYPNVWTLVKAAPAGTEYVTSAFAAATDIRIEAGAADVYYQEGVNAAILERRGQRGQGAPGVLDATGALTAAMMSAGIVTSAAAAVTATVPTGTVMDAALEMEIGESFDWSVIKVGANAFTVTAATGHTLVGVAATAATSHGIYRTRKTAAAPYVTYRVG